MPDLSPQALASLKKAAALPPYVRTALEEAWRNGAPPPRGSVTVLDRFFMRLESAGRPLDRPIAEDFTGERSRSSFRLLMTALARFAPDIPLAEAGPERQRWDRLLNQSYGKKPKRVRPSTRIALPPEAWPQRWQEALPSLDKTWRGPTGPRKPLCAKTRENVVQAMGMLQASRLWSQERDHPTGEALDIEAIEIFLRYLHHQRKVSARTSADYIERVRILGRRGGLLSPEADAVCAEIIGALREEADEAPRQTERLRQFLGTFSLGDLLREAEGRVERSLSLPAHLAKAARLRREAVVLVLLVNTCDRQADLSSLRIGREIIRHEQGGWHIDLRQQKTGIRKELGPLWPLTSRLIDMHVLGGRPESFIADRLAGLQGCNLLSLAPDGFATHYPSAVLDRAFGIRAHLVRNLTTDLIRRERPDSAWAVQCMLGHGNETMQREYEINFRRDASVREWHGVLEEMLLQKSDAA